MNKSIKLHEIGIKIKQLQNEIAELERELATSNIEDLDQLNAWKGNVRPRSAVTRLNALELYDEALEYAQMIMETGYPPKDGEHYLFESVMTQCLGDDIFDMLNSARE